MFNGIVKRCNGSFAYIQSKSGDIYDIDNRAYPDLKNGQYVSFEGIQIRRMGFPKAVDIKVIPLWKRVLNKLIGR